jgi:glucokinase
VNLRNLKTSEVVTGKLKLNQFAIKTNSMEEVIGIDLGGTSIKIGRFTADGRCIKHFSIPTPQPSTPEAVLDAMVQGMAQIISDFSKLRGIGVGTPGPVDATGRVARLAINLDGWYDIPIAGWLQTKTGLPTILGNDANCAALGEAWLGAGQKRQNMIMLTLGTGVGGAIIFNGQLYTGTQGAAGELGLITLQADGPDCKSGNRGSLEQYISAKAIECDTGKSAAAWGALATAGDPAALEFWRQYGQKLGIGLTSLIYILTPELIIIGGGVSASSQFFLTATHAEIHERVLQPSRAGVEIITAQLGNQAGMLGAAKIAWHMLGVKT